MGHARLDLYYTIYSSLGHYGRGRSNCGLDSDKAFSKSFPSLVFLAIGEINWAHMYMFMYHLDPKFLAETGYKQHVAWSCGTSLLCLLSQSDY